MKKTSLICAMIIVMLLGINCALFQSGQTEGDIKKNEISIKLITKSSMIYILKNQKEEKAKKIVDKVLENFEKFIDPILNKENVMFSAVALDVLFGKLEVIDKKWKSMMKDAFEILECYIEIPIGDKILSNSEARYLKAFFLGIKEACFEFKEK